jgi:Leucine-rich repeat (LRR) protein
MPFFTTTASASEKLVSSIKLATKGERIKHAFGQDGYRENVYSSLQLQVTAFHYDQSSVDVTSEATYRSLHENLLVSQDGMVTATDSAIGQIIVTYGNEQVSLTINANWDYVSQNYALEPIGEPSYGTIQATEVIIEDPKVEMAIRHQLNKWAGTLTAEDMEQLTILDADYQGISNLTGLEFATNLEELYLEGNQIQDLNPVQGLTNLKKLSLGNNQINSLLPLQKLTGLIELSVWKNQLTSLAGVEKLAQLESLNVHTNQIANLELLTNLSSLTTFNGNSNLIESLDFLTTLPMLASIELSHNLVTDIQSLSNLKPQAMINLAGNPLSSESIALLPQLEAQEVYVHYEEYDAAPVHFADPKLEAAIRQQLGVATPLKKGDLFSLFYLDVSEQGITDLTGLEYATNLSTILLTSNQLTNIDALQGLGQLQIVELTRNPLSEEALPTIQALEANFVYINYNLEYDHTPIELAPELEAALKDIYEWPLPITKGDMQSLDYLFLNSRNLTSLKGLEHATNLIGLYVWGNKLTSINELQALEYLQFLNVTKNPIDTTKGTEAAAIIENLLSKGAEVTFDNSFDSTNLLFADPALEYNLSERLDIPLPIMKGDISKISTINLNKYNKSIIRLDGLEHADSVETLYLENNQISDLTPLIQLNNLKGLYLKNNDITDISPLLSLASLKSVDIRNNLLDISPNSPAEKVIKALQAKGVAVTFSWKADTVIKGSFTNENGPLSIYGQLAVNSNQQNYYTSHESTGEFYLKLPEGSYTVTNIMNMMTKESTPLNQRFEIKDGKLLVNGTEKERLEVFIETPFILQGNLTDENGAPMADAELSFNGGNLYSKTDMAGNFAAKMADGVYSVSQITIGNERIPLAISFEIKEKQLFVNGERKDQLEIKLPPVSLSGVVTNGNGSNYAFTSVTVYSNGKWFDNKTDEQGRFNLRLPDGAYSSVYIYDLNKWEIIHTPFEIKGGKLYVNGVTKEQLTVTLPNFSLVGRVTDELGTAMANAEVLVNNSKMSMHLKTDATGAFRYRLEDGTYTIRNITIGHEAAPQNLTFSIIQGKMYVNANQTEQINLQLLPVTVKGKLVDENGIPLTDTAINFTKGDQYFHVRTDSLGQFNLRVEDGSYKIGSLLNINLNMSFEVIAGKLYVNGKSADLLEVNLPSNSLKGIVLDDLGLPVGNVSVLIRSGNQSHAMVSKEDGTFSYRLPDGYYTLYYISYSGSSTTYNTPLEIRDGKLYISGEYKERLEITIPSMTVKGTLVNENGERIANSRVQISDQQTGIRYTEYTDSEGKFNFRLKDGKYRVESMVDTIGEVGLSIPFEVVNKKLVVNGKEAAQLAVQLLPVNFFGSLSYHDGTPVVSGTISLWDYKNFMWHYLKINSDGSFAGRFMDGDYAVYRHDGILLNDMFSIQNGKIVQNGQSMDKLHLNLKELTTIQANITENGQLITNGNIHLSSPGGLVSIGYNVNPNGSANITMQEGIYTISSVSKNGFYTPLAKPLQVEVKAGKLFINGFEQKILNVELNPQKPAVPTGLTVEAKEKNRLHLRWAQQENTYFYKVYRATTSSGVYQEIGISSSNEFVDGNLEASKKYWYKISAVNAEGETEKTAAVSGLTLDAVMSMQGTLVHGGEPLANLTFSMYSVKENKWYDFTTNHEGQFNYQLPDGEYYLAGIWAAPIWYPLERTFTLVDGLANGQTLRFDAQEGPPAPQPGENNLKGMLTNGTKPMANLTFSLQQLESGQWYDATTEANGAFALELPDGTYQIDGIWEASASKWYELNQQFIMKDRSLVGAKELLINVNPNNYNVFGTLMNGSDPIPNNVFSIRTATGEEMWFDTQTDSKGRFGFNLPDGQYWIAGIWVSSISKWYELNQYFTVKNGQLEGAPELAVNVKSTASDYNVVGVLQKGTEILTDIVFSFRSTDGAEVWYNTKTDGNGRFGFTVPDGTYVISGVWLDATHEWFELNQHFTVKNGTLEGGAELMVNLVQEAPSFNVTGSVMKGNEALGNLVFSLRTLNGTITWYDVKTDQNGQFQLQLPDGTYLIEGIWHAVENKWYPLQKNFVVSGSAQVDIVIE